MLIDRNTNRHGPTVRSALSRRSSSYGGVNKVATLVYLSTHGSDDPFRAALPFILGIGSVEEGHETSVWLVGEAAALMKDYVARAVQVPGWPPLEELIATAVSAGIAIFVLPEGAEGSVGERDLEGKNARFATARELARTCASGAEVISI